MEKIGIVIIILLLLFYAWVEHCNEYIAITRENELVEEVKVLIKSINKLEKRIGYSTIYTETEDLYYEKLSSDCGDFNFNDNDLLCD